MIVASRMGSPSIGRSSRKRWHLRRSRSGIAALELAIVSPLFMIIIVGMFELTRIIQVKQVLDYAAHKGCRSGIIPGQGTSYPSFSASSGSCIYQDVTDSLDENNLDPTKATLTVTVGSNTASVYTIGGAKPNYAIAKTGGSGADPLTATSGTTITVKIGMPASSFSWMTPYFVTATTVESESITMAKQ